MSGDPNFICGCYPQGALYYGQPACVHTWTGLTQPTFEDRKLSDEDIERIADRVVEKLKQLSLTT